ncbi:hypothetical protein G7Z17_g1725 [Cylindrodendrum hubeiense]|uniref:Uncharacterized protein n=1 Tax=Cylindrodendrum hubeiense TaxID=595255 RepID=A0A9P5HJ51_9HYPO|nr:hypothetical protein G7Z17_g1725 [Cylindrodendrum hubeiense]
MPRAICSRRPAPEAPVPTASGPTAAEIQEGINNTIQEFCAWVPFRDKGHNIRESWEALREWHRLAIANGQTLEPFPFWALDNLPHKKLQPSFEQGYEIDLSCIATSGTTVLRQLNVESWELILFFDGISQHIMRGLNALTKARSNATLHSLFHDVARIWSKRVNGRNIGRIKRHVKYVHHRDPILQLKQYQARTDDGNIIEINSDSSENTGGDYDTGFGSSDDDDDWYYNEVNDEASDIYVVDDRADYESNESHDENNTISSEGETRLKSDEIHLGDDKGKGKGNDNSNFIEGDRVQGYHDCPSAQASPKANRLIAIGTWAQAPRDASADPLESASSSQHRTESEISDASVGSIDSDMLSISDDLSDTVAKAWSPSGELASIITSAARHLVSAYRRATILSARELHSSLSVTTLSSDSLADSDCPHNASGGSTNNVYETASGGNNRQAQKRARDEDDSNEASGNGDDQWQPPSKKPRTEACRTESQRLACPFWKSNPGKYGKCFNLKLSEIKRVKQHLNRNHTPRHYCNRCYVVYPNELGLETHLTQETCTRGKSAKLEGIGNDQKIKLHSKSNLAHSEWERWFIIWGIVFPDVPRPDSPYMPRGASEDMASFLEFSQRHAPSILFQRIRASGISLSNEEMSLSEQEVLNQGFNDVYQRWLHTFPSLARSATSTPASIGSRLMQHDTVGSLADSGVALGSQTQPSESRFTSSSQGERPSTQHHDSGIGSTQNAAITSSTNEPAEITTSSHSTSQFENELAPPDIEHETVDMARFGDMFPSTWDAIDLDLGDASFESIMRRAGM